MTATLAPPTPRPAPTRPRRGGPGFRGDIEGLRAVAVLLVVAFHAGLPLVDGGFVGVDVFFVISGFLITGLLVDELAATGRISLTEFYARRVRGLRPLSTLGRAATAAGTYALFRPIDRVVVGGDVVAAALWMANWQFAAESAQYMADSAQSPLLHYWSLSVEEQFYVVWPLLLLAVVGRGRLALRSWRVAARRMALALTLLAVLSLTVSWASSEAGPVAYFGLHTRAWELAAGALLALARPSLRLMTRRAALAAAWTGVVLILGSVLVFDEATPFPGLAALGPVVGTMMLVAAGSRVSDSGPSAVLGHRVPRHIGRISYAWYLWHWPCLVLVDARWPQPVVDAAAEHAAPRAPWPLLLAAVVASYVLAVASHFVVEKPLRAARFLRRSQRTSLRFGAGLVVSSLVAAVALVSASLIAEQQEERRALESGIASQASAATPVTPMSPEQARTDVPAVPSACHAGFDDSELPAAATCRLGVPRGGRTIALIGDSHAQHWIPALEAAARERNWTVYVFTKAACPVADVPVWSRPGKSRYDSCARWRANLFDRIASIDGLDAVVVGRYSDYRDLVLLGPRTFSNGATVGGPWRAGAQRAFARLAQAAPSILVMRDVPRPPSDVPTCLSRHLDDAQCRFPRADGMGLDEPLARAEEAAGAAHGVRLVDLNSHICPADPCPVVAPDGKVIYRDADHLAASFSATLSAPLGEAVEAALTRG